MQELASDLLFLARSWARTGHRLG